MAREIERFRLLNDHDNSYAHTMTSLEKRLDAISDLMMRKLDEVLNGSNREKRPSQERTHDRRLVEMEPTAMPGPSRDQEQVLSLITGRDPGQPGRGRVGRDQSQWRRRPLGGHGCSLKTLKKTKSYKDESDGCIDTWIEAMKLHFEGESLKETGMQRTDKQPKEYRLKLCNGEKD